MVTGLIPATGGPLERDTTSVLVTGGRGFVGREVGKLLQREGYRVISMDRAAAESETNEVECDISDAVAVRRVFESEDIRGIIHLAAILPTAAQREPVLATQVNIQGGLNVLEMARRFGVRRFVFGSSLSVYGSYPEDRVVSEADRAAPEDLYGAAKLYVEQLGGAWHESYGLEFVSLRIGRVVGPGARSVSSAWRSQIFEFLDARQPAEIVLPYAGREKILLVHVEEVAKMLVALLQAPRPGHEIYNAACEPVTVEELKRQVEKLNPNVRVRLGGEDVRGNPRVVDWSRFRDEFDFKMVPIFEQMARAAGGDWR